MPDPIQIVGQGSGGDDPQSPISVSTDGVESERRIIPQFPIGFSLGIFSWEELKKYQRHHYPWRCRIEYGRAFIFGLLTGVVSVLIIIAVIMYVSD